VKWKSEGTIGSVVALSQGRLVVRQGNALTLVDAGSGDVLETISVPGMFEVVTESKNPAEGNLYIVSTGGLLAKFIPR
jgi:hypothetical protein